MIDIVCSGVATRNRYAGVVEGGMVIGLGVKGHGMVEIATEIR